MGSLDDLLAAADAPEPNALLLEVPDGILVHPLPLAGNVSPETWLAGLPMSAEVRAGARWTLAVSGPRQTGGEPTQPWADVPDYVDSPAATR
jgi:hypothetical protein